MIGNLSKRFFACALSLAPLVLIASCTKEPVENIQALKENTTIRQQYNYSCGAAALATLLTYHYDDKKSENDTYQAMWEKGDQTKIPEQGFSLLEMKRYLESQGYKAKGYPLSLERVRELGAPAIALLDRPGDINHYVVIKGVIDGFVLVGDPSLGTVAVSYEEFEKELETKFDSEKRMTGSILYITSHAPLGKSNFNKLSEWKSAPFQGSLKQPYRFSVQQPQLIPLSP